MVYRMRFGGACNQAEVYSRDAPCNWIYTVSIILQHTTAHPCTPLHTPVGSWSDFLQWIKDARKQHRSRSSVPAPSVTPQTSHEVASSHEGAQKVWETTVPWDSTSPDIANTTKQVFRIQVLGHCLPANMKEILNVHCINSFRYVFAT